MSKIFCIKTTFFYIIFTSFHQKNSIKQSKSRIHHFQQHSTPKKTLNHQKSFQQKNTQEAPYFRYPN